MRTLRYELGYLLGPGLDHNMQSLGEKLDILITESVMESEHDMCVEYFLDHFRKLVEEAQFLKPEPPEPEEVEISHDDPGLDDCECVHCRGRYEGVQEEAFEDGVQEGRYEARAEKQEEAYNEGFEAGVTAERAAREAKAPNPNQGEIRFGGWHLCDTCHQAVTNPGPCPRCTPSIEKGEE